MKKINQLIQQWERGTVRISSYLNKAGYQKDLMKKYVSSKWLESLGYGAFKLAGDTIEWTGAVKALQEQKGLGIHPGGISAIELRGYGHYIKQGGEVIHLFGNRKETLPKWFTNQNWMNRINYVKTSLFNYKSNSLTSTVSVNNLKVKVSINELAAMEMLFLVPKVQSFEEAYLVMENLTSLRPKYVQQLLEECNSIKVKRLFMWMAEKQNHSWVEDLDLSKINFGNGKRLIVKNGALDKKYNITIPREFNG
ncbi:MAG: hypothetical protein HND52_19730 [Ignavibacteriae bacterium]|nr:hypothetical protein [Ignavibacteriota bacterium]NOH00199.1 hypothetical protein [Ignavibacteriota bacterium]